MTLEGTGFMPWIGRRGRWKTSYARPLRRADTRAELPLLAPLFGVLHGKRYTFQWTTLLIWLYFTEGVVRAWSDRGLSAQLGAAEIVLSLAYFVSAVAFVRLQRSA